MYSGKRQMRRRFQSQNGIWYSKQKKPKIDSLKRITIKEEKIDDPG